MLHHVRRALQPIKRDGEDLTEFNKHGTMYLIFNAFATVAVVYLASTTSLNRWRALLKYDEVVTSPDSPLAFKLQAAVQKRLRKHIRVFKFLVYTFFVSYIGFCGYVAFTQDFERGFDQYMGLFLSIMFTIGFSAIIRLRTVEGLFRITTKRGWAPFFMTMPIGKEAAFIRVASTGLGIYTAIQPTPWLITAAVCGATFRFVSAPFIPHKFVSVRGVALWLLAYILTLAIIVVFMVPALGDTTSTDKINSGSRNANPMGKRAVAWYSASLQYSAYFSGVLSALVLRAEWAAAQAAAETRTRATLDIHYAEKEALLEKVDDSTEVEESAVAPAAPEPTSTPLPESLVPSTPATPTQPQPAPKARAIRVPPVDPFHLSKDAKTAGRLEPFSSPVFNILLLTTFICNIPAILLSTPTLSNYTTENVNWELLHLFPGQFWTLLINPLVLVFVVLVRWNKGGKEIWRYGEKWAKDLPKKEETSPTTETPAPTPAPATQVDVESQTPLLSGNAA